MGGTVLVLVSTLAELFVLLARDRGSSILAIKSSVVPEPMKLVVASIEHSSTVDALLFIYPSVCVVWTC